jgi:two-component system chemotaxis response regulator CheB
MIDHMIKAFVVDDSHFMQVVIKNILESDPNIRVVGSASEGREAIEKIKELKPDVVTLDVMMPSMDGLETLKEIMRIAPTRVVMISAAEKESADIVVKCLESGAVSFISKPRGQISAGMYGIANEIIEGVKQAAALDIEKLKERRILPNVKRGKTAYETADFAVGLCASLGGIRSVEKVIMPLRESRASFFLVQHMVPEVIDSFAERLDSVSALYVKVAGEDEEVRGNVLYIAPGDMHMRVIDGRISLSREERVNGVRPSADILFASLAEEYGPRSIGIVLSGTGRDGARGMKEMHARGAKTIAEASETALAFNMPKNAIELGAVDMILRADEIPRVIEDTVQERWEKNGRVL